MTQCQPFLAEYAATGSETAFRELVAGYLGLVYSAALRLVEGDAHQAEDIAQTVFADLARKARSLPADVMLGGWLHRHTCFVASNTLRAERRRQARERQAVEMNIPEDHSAENLAQIAPVLDEAINELGAEDRTAILLRFFEQHDFRTIGTTLGNSEDAARKRVDRALEKLQGLLRRRGVALSVTALGSLLAANAVSAAPAGLALSISSVALAGATAGTTSATTVLKIMSMTKLNIAIVSAIVIAGVTVPLVLQQRARSQLAAANAALERENAEKARLAAEVERLSKQVAQTRPTPATNADNTEVLRLRGEVGKLRQDVKEVAASKTNGPSTLSGLTSNPEMFKMIRTQQKAGMSMIYQGLTNRISLSSDQVGKLNDLLADNVMENIDHITEVLAEGKSPEQMEAVFAAQEAAVREKVRALLGDEGLTQYEDYTKNLASSITAEQFKSKLTGDTAAKDQKSKQLYELLQAESQQLLAENGLSADYQLVPTLNFRNFASDSAADKNLKMLEDVYTRAAARAGSFLSEDDLTKFTEFRTAAINMNRLALKMNRQMMSPGPK